MSIATKQIAETLTSRGLKLRLYEPRELVIVAPKDKADEATEKLIDALRMFKEELIVDMNLTPIPKKIKPGKILPYDRFYDEPIPPDDKIAKECVDRNPGTAIHFRYRDGQEEPVLWTWTGAKEWYPF